MREYRPPGSVRGALGNRRPYLDKASPGAAARSLGDPGRWSAARRGGGMGELGPVGDSGERTWRKHCRQEADGGREGRGAAATDVGIVNEPSG